MIIKKRKIDNVKWDDLRWNAVLWIRMKGNFLFLFNIIYRFKNTKHICIFLSIISLFHFLFISLSYIFHLSWFIFHFSYYIFLLILISSFYIPIISSFYIPIIYLLFIIISFLSFLSILCIFYLSLFLNDYDKQVTTSSAHGPPTWPSYLVNRYGIDLWPPYPPPLSTRRPCSFFILPKSPVFCSCQCR